MLTQVWQSLLTSSPSHSPLPVRTYTQYKLSLYIRINSCGLTRKWDNRNLQKSSTMDFSKAKKKIYTAKKNMNATLNATYINPFNRLNKIKDKIRSENSRKALVDFSIFGRRRQKLFSEERREILNFSKISLVVVSVYSR